MNYSDFQILSNDEYELMKTQYLTQRNFDRAETIAFVFQKLSFCKNMLTCINKNLNLKIKLSLEESNENINNILNNLETLFSFSKSKEKTCQQFNIFLLINNLLETTKIFINWSENENKEIIKSFTKKTTNTLIEIILNITKNLETSYFKFYKYM